MASDAELVAAVLGGDALPFAELVARHDRGVRVVAWGVLRDHHAAQDAAQEAFIIAYRRLGELRDASAFGAWVATIARNVAMDSARARTRIRLIAAGPIPERATEEVAEEDERSADVIAAVGNLPESERTVVMLRYFDRQTIAEVARTTGRPVGTVTKQLSRAIARLREKLRERS